MRLNSLAMTTLSAASNAQQASVRVAILCFFVGTFFSDIKNTSKMWAAVKIKNPHAKAWGDILS
jgi:hypothetical protein